MEPLDLCVTMESVSGRSSKSSPISYVVNRKGKTLLMHQSRFYLKHKEYKCGDVMWRCTSKPCRSFLTLNRDEEITQMTPHTCERIDIKAHKKANVSTSKATTAHRQGTTKDPVRAAHSSQSASKVLNVISHISHNLKNKPVFISKYDPQNRDHTDPRAKTASVPQNSATDPNGRATCVQPASKSTTIPQNTTKDPVVGAVDLSQNTMSPLANSQNAMTGTQVLVDGQPRTVHRVIFGYGLSAPVIAACTQENQQTNVSSVTNSVQLNTIPLVSKTSAQSPLATTSQVSAQHSSAQASTAKKRRASQAEPTWTPEQMDDMLELYNSVTQTQDSQLQESYYFAKLVQFKLRKLSEERQNLMMIKICQLFQEESLQGIHNDS